jgi:hypothetical protein
MTISDLTEDNQDSNLTLEPPSPIVSEAQDSTFPYVPVHPSLDDSDQVLDRALDFFNTFSERETQLEKHIKKLERSLSHLQGNIAKLDPASSPGRHKRSKKRKKAARVSSPPKGATWKSQSVAQFGLHPKYPFFLDYEPTGVDKTEACSHGPIRITYTNGDVRLKFRDGCVRTKHDSFVFTAYPNGDYQQEYPDGATCYKYVSNGSVELRLPNGGVILLFTDGQKEEHFMDGRKRVISKNGSVTEIGPDGTPLIVHKGK